LVQIFTQYSVSHDVWSASYLSLYSIPPARILAQPLLTDSNNAWTAGRQRLLVPVAVLLHNLKAVVVQERFEFLWVRKATGDARFFCVFAFAIAPATIRGPVHHLSKRIIDLCKVYVTMTYKVSHMTYFISQNVRQIDD
jgi:hypothetical protein